VAAEDAHHRGDHRAAERLVLDGLDRATDRIGKWSCLTVMSVLALADGAHADVVEHALAAAALAPDPRENLGTAALALAYSGDLDQARTLNDPGLVGTEAPTLRAWTAYVAGEIERCAGQPERAERHHRNAVELARGSGATFLVGLATLGLVTVLGRGGRVDDTLRGYRDVVDYFARTGSWSHLWTTLRNLAEVLRRLGDPERAALLDTAADEASATPGPAAPGRARAQALDVALRAIEHHLAEAGCQPS
jgi:tetratricopeptide (TPR) repeat protein